MSIRDFSPEQRHKLLKKIYTEIIRGYSTLEWDGSFVYIKHINHFDIFDTDEYYNGRLEYARMKGLLSEEERLEDLKISNKWGVEQEEKIKSLSDYLDLLLKSRKKLITNEDKEVNKKAIEDTQIDLNNLLIEKTRLIGRTCESYAIQKQNEFYLMHILYKDKDFQKFYYDFNTFDELEGYEINELFAASNNALDNLTELNIKYLAVANFFQNIFGLAETVYEFYGKPISQLTFYQSNLSLYGSNYKYMLQQAENIPSTIKEDPEKLEDWYHDVQNRQKIEEKAGGPTNIMGQDNTGSGEGVINLTSLKKNKGAVSKEDLMKSIKSS